MSDKEYSIDEVINFCKDFKYKIFIVNRKDRKNQIFRESVGITIDEEKAEIRNIRKEFLIQGPFKDKDYPNNYLYEFHKHVCGKWCYIKISIDDKNLVIKVISFHESEGIDYE